MKIYNIELKRYHHNISIDTSTSTFRWIAKAEDTTDYISSADVEEFIKWIKLNYKEVI